MADQQHRHDAAVLLALHNARIRLYRRQSGLIAAAALPYLRKVDIDRLAGLLGLLASTEPGGFDRKTRAAQAVSTVTGAVWDGQGPPADWDDANSVAAEAAAARGWAEADAGIDGIGPDHLRKVKNRLTAAAAAVVGLGLGNDWTGRQIGRLGWELSAQDLLEAPDPTAAIGAAVTDGTAVRGAAEDSMHATWAQGFAARMTAGGQQGRLVAWVTEHDDRVCPDCRANEAEGPYPVDSVPEMPAHPTCRCGLRPYLEA